MDSQECTELDICERCTHKEVNSGEYEEVCWECKYFYADKFESREINNDQIR